jgi:hypothetical protein
MTEILRCDRPGAYPEHAFECGECGDELRVEGKHWDMASTRAVSEAGWLVSSDGDDLCPVCNPFLARSDERHP